MSAAQTSAAGRKARVSDEQISVAIEWLMVNEGVDDGEMDACRAVADMLRRELDYRLMRKVAREAKVTISRARAALAAAKTGGA